MRWTRHAASVEEMESAYKILVGKIERRRALRKQGVEVMIILKLALHKKVQKCGLD
jgi:hypothetical protein